MFKFSREKSFGKLSIEKWEQWGGQDKGVNASGVNRQGSKPVASYWVLSEKENRTKDAILYGRKG